MKGVAERSSVFASEIFTTISPITEEPPEVIHISKMSLKELAIIELNPLLFFLICEINKENNLEVFKQAYHIKCSL